MAHYSSGNGCPKLRMKDYFEFLQDPKLLHEWLEENYEKVTGFDILNEEIIFLLNFYNPEINADEVTSPKALAKLLSFHLLDVHTKLKKFDVELGEIAEVTEALTLGKIENHKIKVFKVLEEYEDKLMKANDEVIMCKEHIAHLDSELTGALIKIQYLERETNVNYLDESLDESSFIADLQGRVAATNCLNSSMKQELKQTRDLNSQLQLLICDLRKQRVAEQEECMVDIAESVKKNKSRLEDTVKEVIQSSKDFAPNPETLEKIIEEWKTNLKESISKNEKDINVLLDKLDDQNTELNSLETEEIMMSEQLEDRKFQANRIKEMIEIFEEEIERLNKEKEQITVLLDNARFNTQRLIESAPQLLTLQPGPSISSPQQYVFSSLEIPEMEPSYVPLESYYDPAEALEEVIVPEEAEEYYDAPQFYPSYSPSIRKPVVKSTMRSRRRIITTPWDI